MARALLLGEGVYNVLGGGAQTEKIQNLFIDECELCCVIQVSQLNRQIAEMEAQSSEHNSIINQTSNQLNETHTKLAYLNTQLQISHRLSGECLFMGVFLEFF